MKEVEHMSGLDEINDNTPAPEEEQMDPFSPEHAPGLSLIVLMRIYDTQLALLRHADPEVAESLVNLHAEGKILGPLPYLESV